MEGNVDLPISFSLEEDNLLTGERSKLSSLYTCILALINC